MGRLVTRAGRLVVRASSLVARASSLVAMDSRFVAKATGLVVRACIAAGAEEAGSGCVPFVGYFSGLHFVREAHSPLLHIVIKARLIHQEVVQQYGGRHYNMTNVQILSTVDLRPRCTETTYMCRYV